MSPLKLLLLATLCFCAVGVASTASPESAVEAEVAVDEFQMPHDLASQQEGQGGMKRRKFVKALPWLGSAATLVTVALLLAYVLSKELGKISMGERSDENPAEGEQGETGEGL